MAKDKEYEVSIESSTEYEDLLADIYFPSRGAAIISQEKKPGNFEISIYSMAENEDSNDNYSYCRNIEELKIPLDDFLEAINTAVSELKRLKRAD